MGSHQFMTGLTNNRAAFLGGDKIQVGRDFKTLREDFYFIKFNKCVNLLQSSRMTYLKGFTSCINRK